MLLVIGILALVIAVIFIVAGISYEAKEAIIAGFFLLLLGVLLLLVINDSTSKEDVIKPKPPAVPTVTITEKEYILLLQNENYTEVKDAGVN